MVVIGQNAEAMCVQRPRYDLQGGGIRMLQAESKSIVSVHILSVFNNKCTQADIVEHVNGGVMNKTSQGGRSETKSFTTTEALVEEMGNDGVPSKYTCVSKGVLENKILGIVEGVSIKK